jgi:hypothetical protein
MAKPIAWHSEAASIYRTIQQAEENCRFNWRDVATLFGLGRRSAYKILASLKPHKIVSGASTTSRAQLLDWLEPQKQMVEERLRVASSLQAALRTQELEQEAIRQALLKKLKAEASSWTLTPAFAGSTVSTLPENVRLGPGKIEIDFSAGHPAEAAVKLYALGMALLNDWPGFVAATAPQSSSSGLSQKAQQVESALEHR